MKEVIAAIIIKGNLILIAKRGAKEEQYGKWEFPGGKIELEETPQQCLKREIKEELCLDIEVGDFFGDSIYSYPQGQIRLLAYIATIIKGEIQLSVHDEIKWVKTNELNNYDFAPADIPIVERLLKLNSSKAEQDKF